MRTRWATAAAGMILAMWTAVASAAPPAPPTNLTAQDHPWDGGEKIDLTWQLSPDDASGVASYFVYRSMTRAEIAQEDEAAVEKAAKAAIKAAAESARAAAIEAGASDSQARAAGLQAGLEAGAAAAAAKRAELAASAAQVKFRFHDTVKAGADRATVDKLHHDDLYTFQVVAVNAAGEQSEPTATDQPIQPTRESFDGGRLWLGIILTLLCGAVGLFIALARSGMDLRVRKIAGLEAVDEAVGRATEMGRSVLFIPGIQDMNDIQTIAGITVLSRVAKTAAEYDAKVEVPTARSLVMTAARETVQSAYLSAGRPDAFNSDLIYYVTDEQFGYVAYLSGMMVREKPAACFYMGHFFAESLILAETGNAIGAIQVAGTAAPAQLPFFVAACDYTLIGEEFFAASAYLSGEPEQLGSLKGQDVGKVIVAVLLVIGVVLTTAAAVAGLPGAEQVVEFLKGTMLT